MLYLSQAICLSVTGVDCYWFSYGVGITNKRQWFLLIIPFVLMHKLSNLMNKFPLLSPPLAYITLYVACDFNVSLVILRFIPCVLNVLHCILHVRPLLRALSLFSLGRGAIKFIYYYNFYWLISTVKEYISRSLAKTGFFIQSGFNLWKIYQIESLTRTLFSITF